MKRLVSILTATTLISALAVGAVSAYTNYGNGWEAEPGQTSTGFGASVQQPINADGSSTFKAKGSSVIPVKFALTQGTGPFVFESVRTGGETWSNLVYTPQTATTVAAITNLSAVYDFAVGDCAGGSLRWTLGTSVDGVKWAGDTIDVYFYSPFTATGVRCIKENNRSGQNLLALGGNVESDGVTPKYHDWADTLAAHGGATVHWAALIVDSYWGDRGDQVVDLTSATFNSTTFVVPGPSASSRVCPTQRATIRITKQDGTATSDVNEPLTVQPKDDNGIFRVVDCKYMYNLATSSLSGTGTYRVYATIDKVEFFVAKFDLK